LGPAGAWSELSHGGNAHGVRSGEWLSLGVTVAAASTTVGGSGTGGGSGWRLGTGGGGSRRLSGESQPICKFILFFQLGCV